MNSLPDELCALKHIIPTSGPGRVENELKCLQDIGYVWKKTFLNYWFMGHSVIHSFIQVHVPYLV